MGSDALRTIFEAEEQERQRLACRLPAEVETALYRAVQQALATAGSASAITVVLVRRNGTVVAVVEHDGECGAPPPGVRERIELLDGHVETQSHGGAALVAEVPLP